jgi:hypothetical protein
MHGAYNIDASTHQEMRKALKKFNTKTNGRDSGVDAGMILKSVLGNYTECDDID